MKLSTVFQLLTILLLQLGAPATVTAEDPSASDISVVAFEGPPPCTQPEGEVRISNSSDEYDYKVGIAADATSDNNGPAGCMNGCTYQACRFDFTSTVTVNAGASNVTVDTPARLMPICSASQCGTICDNDQTCPGGPYHCVCVDGTYTVKWYRTTADPDATPPVEAGEWTQMQPEVTSDITSKIVDSSCYSMHRCEY